MNIVFFRRWIGLCLILACVLGCVQARASIGTQNISADVKLTPGTRVSVQYNFQSHSADLTNVSGALAIDGATLVVSAESGAVDTVGPGVQTFTIANATSVTGTFGQVLSEDPTVSVRVIYNATSVQIELTRVPVITQQPEGGVVASGANKTLSVSVDAVSGVNYSYQWLRNGAAIADEKGTTLSLSNLQSSGVYGVTVTANGAVAKSEAAPIVVETSNFAEVHAALMNRNYDLASTKLAAILAVAPNHPQANLYKGITDIVRLTTDPASKTMLTKLGFAGNSDLRSFTLSHMGFNASSLTSEARTWLSGTLYPRLKAADDLLAKITDTTVIGVIKDSDLGAATSVDFKTFDYGDVQVLRAGLNAFMAFLKWIEMQNTDVNLLSFRNDAAAGLLSLESILAKNPSLFAASSTAPAAQLEFTARLKSAIDYYLKFSDFANPLPAATGAKRVESFPAVALLESAEDYTKERRFRSDCVLLQKSIAAVDASSGVQEFVRISSGPERHWITASPYVFVKHPAGIRNELPAFKANAYKIGSLKYDSAVAFYPALTMQRLGEIEQKLIEAEPKITEKLGTGGEKVPPVVAISKVAQVSPGWLSVTGTASDASGVTRVSVRRTTGTDVSSALAVLTERLPVGADGKRMYDWTAQVAAPVGTATIDVRVMDTLGNKANVVSSSATVASMSVPAPVVAPVGQGVFQGQPAALVATVPTTGKLQYQWSKNGTVVSSGEAYAVNDWASVSAGIHHTAAIKRDGSLWTWGWNNANALGHSSSGQIDATPQQVGSDLTWESVACGESFTVALKRDGTMWAWGQTPWGQQGMTQVESSKRWRRVSVGRYHVLALARDGGLYERANGSSRQVGFDVDWDQIAAGNGRSFALKTDGTMWAWGDNNTGTLGLPWWWSGDVFDPVQIGTDSDWVTLGASRSTAGYGNDYTAAIKADGSLWVWGHTPQGAYGLGWNYTLAEPTRVGPENRIWAGVQVGSYDLYARSPDGNVFGVRRDYVYHRFLSAGASVVSAGDGFAGAVSADGVLWMWGQNYHGQLGNSWLPTEVPDAYYDSPMQLGVHSEWGLPSPATGVPVAVNFGSVTSDDFGNYQLSVSKGGGSVSSTATLFEQEEQSTELINATGNVNLNGGSAPRYILVQGGSVVLSGAKQAGSNSNTSAKWFKNGVAITGTPSINSAAGAGVYWTETTAVGGGSLRSEATVVAVDSPNVTAARAALANKNYTVASQKITAALSATPADPTALLLRSMLDLYSLTTDPAAMTALNSLGFSGSLDPWNFSLTQNPDGVPTGAMSSTTRAWLVGTFFQKLSAVDVNLAKITDLKTIILLNSAELRPGNAPGEAKAVDYGDIQVLRAFINMTMALVKWVETQNTDVDLSMLQRYRESGVLSMQLLLAKYPALFAASGTATAAQTEFVARFKQSLTLYLAFSDFVNPTTGLPKRLDASLCVASIESEEDRRKETIARGDVVRTLESISATDVIAGRRDLVTTDSKHVVSAYAFVKHAPGWRSDFPQFSRNRYTLFSFKPSVPQSLIPAFTLTQMANLEDSLLAQESRLTQWFGTRDGNLIPQVITFPELPAISSSAAPIRLSGSSDSGLPVTYSVVSGPATVSGSTLTLTKMGGVVTVRASQNGNGVYEMAPPVERHFSVTATQSITFAKPAGVFTYGDAPLALLASADSGLTVTFKVLSGPASVDGNTLTFTGAGDVSIQADQSGNEVYLAAKPVKQTITVAKKQIMVSIDPAVRLVGFANPTFSFRYNGLVGSDSADSLAKKPTATTTAALTSASGSYPIIASGATDKNYTFAYTPGTLTLNGFGGAYEALLLDQDHAPIGKLELTVPLNSLAYSGKLILSTEAKPVTLVGVLQANSDGSAAVSTLTLTRKDLPTLILNIGVTGDSLTATLGRGDLPELTSGTTGTRLYTVPAKANAPWAGTYTMVFGDPTSSDVQKRDYPHGANYASVVITPATGILAFTGKLADGTNISGKMNPDAKGRYRLLIYESRIYFSGQLSLMAHPDTERFPNSFYIPSSSAESFLVWANTGGPKDNSYRAGFGPLEYGVSLDPWHAPVTGSKTVVARTLGQQLGLVSGSTESATISVDYSPDSIDLGTLGASLPRKVSLAPGATVSVVESVTPPVNATKWTISVKPETGVFTGSFTLVDIVTSLATRHTRNVSFYGILRQGPTGDTAVGNGFFLLPALPSAATPEQPSLEIQLSVPAQ
ncbi:MAG: MBG domain-containing protein [Verrucomicrobiota bacterium]